MGETYTAIVVGCGSIGTSKDSRFDSPTGSNILTHCNAIQSHPRTNLIAVIDTNTEKARQAAKKWNTQWYRIVPEIHYDQGLWPDIVVVAVPTEVHFQMLMQIVNRGNAKLVIAEKPFTDNSTQAKQVIDAYKVANIPLLVNYTRRFVPEFQRIRDIIQSQELGAVQGCRAIYTRGLKREASHLIDLCNWFFGDCIRGHIEEANVRHLLTDYSNDDPTYAAHLTYSGCPHVFFSPADGRHFSVFEVDILLEGGRITLVEHGRKYTMYTVEPEPVYGDYMALSYDGQTFETGLNRALLGLVDNAVDHLDTGKPLLCSGQEALRVHEVLERLT